KPKSNAPVQTKELPVLKRFTPGDLQVMFQLYVEDDHCGSYCSAPVLSLWPASGWTDAEAHNFYNELLTNVETDIADKRYAMIVITTNHHKIATALYIYEEIKLDQVPLIF